MFKGLIVAIVEAAVSIGVSGREVDGIRMSQRLIGSPHSNGANIS
jgi:hypothetical protein